LKRQRRPCRTVSVATCCVATPVSGVEWIASIGSYSTRDCKRILSALGYGAVYPHLVEVLERRNEFVHGNAEAVDDNLVYVTIEKLHEVQEAWLALCNKRCTGNAKAPPVWRGSSPF
jgi:hypothetical protein